MPAHFCTGLESWGQDFHRFSQKVGQTSCKNAMKTSKQWRTMANNNHLGCIQATQIAPTAHWRCPFPGDKLVQWFVLICDILWRINKNPHFSQTFHWCYRNTRKGLINEEGLWCILKKAGKHPNHKTLTNYELCWARRRWRHNRSSRDRQRGRNGNAPRPVVTSWSEKSSACTASPITMWWFLSYWTFPMELVVMTHGPIILQTITYYIVIYCSDITYYNEQSLNIMYMEYNIDCDITYGYIYISIIYNYITLYMGQLYYRLLIDYIYYIHKSIDCTVSVHGISSSVFWWRSRPVLVGLWCHPGDGAPHGVPGTAVNHS